MGSLANRLLRRFNLELRRYRPAPHTDVVHLKAEGKARGRVLLAYILEPFQLGKGKTPSNAHTHHVESLLMAQVFRELGYHVDVIDFRNRSFQPKRDYAFFVSARVHLDAIAERLAPECVKIAHLDTAHFLFNNAAAYARLLALRDRRGVATHSLKLIEANWAPEHADYLTILGNDFTLSTYRYAGKPMHALPVPTPNDYPSPVDKDYETVRNRYLWMGSHGFAHKGLDLVLEAFACMPDKHLTVCGPTDHGAERQFVAAYHRELYETINIETVGWVDVGSKDFQRLVDGCLGLIYPSASEGQAGAVVTCMRAGLIPLVSRESGVDVGDYGAFVTESTIGEIKRVVRKTSARTLDELRDMATRGWEHARDHHSRAGYLKRYRQVIEAIVAETAAR
jgi:glycosyltransferase involved in cell wall biosynthesis